MDDFDTIDDEQLVNLISSNPEIYDPRNQSYKLPTKKDHIWMSISQSLNKSTVACKKRWKNIRDNYYKQKKTIKKPTGTLRFGNRKRNALMNQLGFLDIVEHERKYKTELDQNDTTDNTSQDHLDDISTDESMEANDIPTDIPNLSTPHKPTQAFSKTTTNIKSSSNDKGVPLQKRGKNLSSEIPSTVNSSSLEQEALMDQLTAVPCVPSPEDEIDVLFKSLAITIKTFPPLLRAETKRKIFQVISDAELQLLRPEPPTTPTN